MEVIFWEFDYLASPSILVKVDGVYTGGCDYKD